MQSEAFCSRAIVTGAQRHREGNRPRTLLPRRAGGQRGREDRPGGCSAGGRSGGRIIAVGGDISLEEARKRLLDHALAEFGGLDIFVNNAGIGATGLFASAGPERLRQLMEVNFFALAEMTRLAIPHLRRGTRPIVVNLSSILGRRGVPHNSEYCASKFAVHGFSEAIRTELAGEGIDVLVVSPGTTETEFFDRVIDRSSEPAWPSIDPSRPPMSPSEPWPPCGRGNVRSFLISGAGFSAR